MSEKIAIIGSNCFSGAHFVAHCLSEGCELVGISRSPEPHPVFLPYHGNPNQKNFRFHQLDLNCDLEAIMDVLDTFQPHFVVNFAAQGMVAQSWECPADWFNTNLVAAVNLHDQLRRREWLKKFVQISTPEVYGSCEGDVKGSTIYNPSTPYAVSKAAVDMSLMAFKTAYNFPVVFTRAANVYGPGQALYRIIPAAALKFLTGEKLQLHGGGVSTRSFIHIRDVADGTLKVARNAPLGEIYHLSTPRQISIRALVEMIAEMLGVKFNEQVEIVGERLGKDAAYSLNPDKARKELGWHDQIQLENGIENVVKWVKDNIEVLKNMPKQYIHRT